MNSSEIFATHSVLLSMTFARHTFRSTRAQTLREGTSDVSHIKYVVYSSINCAMFYSKGIACFHDACDKRHVEMSHLQAELKDDLACSQVWIAS
jgi:hypothetical protein